MKRISRMASNHEVGVQLPAGALWTKVFAETDKDKALALIDSYSTYWTEIIGTRGFKGKKAINGNAMFDMLFEVEGGDDVIEESPEEEFDETKLEHLGE